MNFLILSHIILMLNTESFCRERASFWWNRCCSLNYFGAGLLRDNPPKVEFSTRMKRVNGLCKNYENFSRSLIVLNFETAVLSGEKFDQTIGHEIAHAFINMLYQRQIGHGPAWRLTMQELGLPPLRCSSYEGVSHTVKRHSRYPIECQNCKKIWHLTNNLITRIRSGNVRKCSCGAQIHKDNLRILWEFSEKPSQIL